MEITELFNWLEVLLGVLLLSIKMERFKRHFNPFNLNYPLLFTKSVTKNAMSLANCCESPWSCAVAPSQI